MPLVSLALALMVVGPHSTKFLCAVLVGGDNRSSLLALPSAWDHLPWHLSLKHSAMPESVDLQAAAYRFSLGHKLKLNRPWSLTQ
jgi:hypothetical protein